MDDKDLSPLNGLAADFDGQVDSGFYKGALDEPAKCQEKSGPGSGVNWDFASKLMKSLLRKLN